MPGIERLGVEELLGQAESDLELGIRSVLLFGLAADGTKDPEGRHAADPKGAAPEAVAARVKAAQ